MKLDFIKGLPENLALCVNTLQGNFLVSYKEGIDQELMGKIDTIFLTSQSEPFFRFIQQSVPRIFGAKIKLMVPQGGKEKFHNLESTSISLEEFQFDENFKIPDTNIICKCFRLNDTEFGLKFEGVVYLSSETIPFDAHKYFYSARSIIFDLPSETAIKLSAQFKPDLSILTDQKVETEEMNRKWVKELSGYKGTSFLSAHPGQPMEVDRDFTQRLSENKKSFSIPSAKCKSLVTGMASLILHHKLLRDFANKITYLTDDSTCYGVIKLGMPYKIDLTDFDSLQQKHLITKEELSAWWPGKEVLFAYPFDLVEVFSKPLKVQLNENYEVEDFLGEINEPEILPTIMPEKENQLVPNLSSDSIGWFEKEVASTNSADEIISLTEENKKYSVEKMYGGIPVRVSKINNKISILNHNRKDVTRENSQIALELFCLTGKNFVVEGEIVGNILYCSDCLMVGDYNLSELEWHERKSQLHSLSFTKNIKEVESTIVSGKQGMEQILSIIKTIPSFKYASIKNYEDLYTDKKSKLVIFESVKNAGIAGSTTTSSPGISGVQGHELPKKKKVISPTDQYPPDPFNFSQKTDLTFIDSEELSESNVANHDFFDTWSGPMAYFLGLLSTDGNVDLSTNRIEFFMHPQDGSILGEFAKLLGDPVGPKEISGYSAYRFKSKQMVDQLRKLGFENKKPTRKTHTFVPDKYKWDFLRGAFDADGSVNQDRVQFDSGNRDLVKWVAGMFESVVPGVVKKYSYESVDKVVVLGKDAQTIHDKIYSGSGPRFKRKAEKKIETT